jgi:signal transduction histidine kinase
MILFVLLLVLPAFGLVLYGEFSRRQIEKARARESAVALSQLAAAHQENPIKRTRQLLTTLAQFEFFVRAKDRPFLETHCANLLKLSPEYSNFGLIEADGTVFCSGLSTNDTGRNVAGQGYFRRAAQTKKFAIGDYEIEHSNGQPVLHLGFPVLNQAGALSRVLFASLKIPLLSEAVAHIPLPASGALTLFDRNGLILARFPDPEMWVGKSFPDALLAKKALEQNERTIEAAGADGIRRLYAVTAITEDESPGLLVCAAIPLHVSLAAANRTLLVNLALLALIAGLVLVGARFYAHRFVLNPIHALVAAANRLARGDLKSRTGLSSHGGELGELAEAFDSMADRLETRQIQIEQANAEITRMNSELEQRVKERTAQLTAANQELEAFSYSVSHDLRAPLRHISGFAELLRHHAGGSLDETAKRYVGIIVDATRQMGKLVDDLLSFSRMGRQELTMIPVEMSELVQTTIREMDSEISGRNIEWNFGGLNRVNGDPGMLRQVWVNLIANALKYTRERTKAKIEILAKETPDEIIFAVSDNGVGFDPQYAGKLFGVFQRLHSDSQFEGTGIGLANVRRIVQRHGGRTWAEGQVNVGATFYFSMPK